MTKKITKKITKIEEVSREAEEQERLEEAAPEMLRLLEIMTGYAERSTWKDPRVYNDDELLEEYDIAIRDAERVIKKVKGNNNA